MNSSIRGTGIGPGDVTSGRKDIKEAVESLCVTVDREVIPGIRSMCKTQKQHNVILHGDDREGGLIEKVCVLEERSRWSKGLLVLVISSLVTAFFTLIVAVIIPAIGG